MDIKIDETYLLTVKAPCEKICFSGHSIFGLMNVEDEALPLLWCRDGEFRLIPKEVVMNAVNLSKIFQQIDLKYTPPMIFFVWSQGIPISNQAGRALIGE
ncbi:hypothetical protein LCGC14_0684520 [marine sediment metagenome]|uniref:Uncharacterized protein n=1 Tax=marine sediment metagenome TaxID=412755 RepID=A0A0F9QSB0_9ZZZZ